MQNHPRILFGVPLPPPVHGSSMVCQQIQQSEKINAAFDCRYVNLSTSRGNDEVAGFSPLLLLKKGGRFISSFLQTFWQLLIFRPQKCYVAIACRGGGLSEGCTLCAIVEDVWLQDYSAPAQ